MQKIEIVKDIVYVTPRCGTTGKASVDDLALIESKTWGIIQSRVKSGTYPPYLCCYVNRARVYLHRLVVQCETGVVDHIDGDTLNNCRSNLRVVSQRENMWNRKKRAAATSRFKGVFLDRKLGKWRAAITCDGKKKHLGVFTDELSAAIAYNNAAVQLFGEFSMLNELD